MEKFLQELLGTTDAWSYLAWFILALVGALTASLIRNHVTNLKSYPINYIQLLVGFLITFIFIRFSNELVGLEPTAFGALMIGATNNEIALRFIKRLIPASPQAQDIGGSNPPPSKDEK